MEIRMLLFAAIVLLVLRFMPEGVTKWTRDRLERECPRCKVRNAFSRRECRVCFSPIRRELQKTTP